MLKQRGFIIAVSIVLLTVGYAVYDVQHEKTSDSVKAETSRIVPVEKDQVQEVTLTHFAPSTNVANEIFKLLRTEGGWKIKSPIQEVADQNSILDFVEGISLEKSKDVVKTGLGIDWKIYGLANPKGFLSLKMNNGKEYKVFVSTIKNFSGDPYLRIDGDDKVLVGNTTWLQKMGKKAFDFRDKRLMKNDAAKVDIINISQIDRKKTQSSRITMTKKESKWTLDEKPTWSLDQAKSSEVVYLLNTIQVLDFAKEATTDTTGKVSEIKNSELKQYGLDKPLLKIKATLKDKSVFTADFALSAKNEYFVLTSEPKRILKIAAQDFEKLGNLSLEYFRDRRAAFNFPREEVKKVHLEVGELRADFEQKNDEWTVLNPDSKLQYTLERVKALVALVRNLDIGDFEPAQKEIKDEKYKVKFMDQSGKIIFEASFGELYQKNSTGGAKAFYLTKSSASQDLLGVDQGSLKGIGFESILSLKTSQKNEEKK